MKNLFKILGGLLCLGALASPSAGLADVVKEKAVYTYDDSMGEVPTDVWSKYDHDLFDKDGKRVLSLQLTRSKTGDEIALNQNTEYVYNESGRLIEAIQYTASATSPDNVDKEYVFTRSQHDVWEYNESGQLTAQYYEQWSKSKEAWNTDQLDYYAYTYDSDGKVSEEKYWRQRMRKTNGDYNDPSRTTTYEYDADGKVTKSISTGVFADHCFDTEYTYDAQGRCIHTVKTCSLASSQGYNQVVEEKEWEYDGDFLLTVTTTKNTYKKVDGVAQLNSTTISRTRNEKVENDPCRYFSYGEEYHEDTGTWVRFPPMFTEHVSQDYAGMGELIPAVNVTASAANPKDVVVKFTLPEISYSNYAVQVYRDGVVIRTYTKDELAAIAEGSGYSFTDAGISSGEHKYYAQLLVGDADQTVDDMDEGYISDIATVTVVIDYPNVTDFRIKGYTLKRTWEPESKDWDDDGNEVTIPGFWREEYRLVLEWTPLTEEQVAGYGFERYEIYYKTKYSSAAVENVTDLAAGTVTLDWIDSYKEVWLAVKYGEDRVETLHIPIDISQLTDLSAKDPKPAYGVIYEDGNTPAFVKIDLSKPEEAPEVIYNIYEEHQTEMLNMFGGVSVGDSYYALYDDSYGICLGAFNMADKKFVKVGETYNSLPESSFSDLLYDSQSEKLYAVVPDADASWLYAVDTSTGVAAKSDIALPEYTLYLADAGNGMAYAMAAETGKFQLYSVDLATGTCTKVEGVTVDGKMNTWSSLAYSDNQLYFNLNTKFYTINLADNTVTTNNDFSKGVSGITFTESTALPDIVDAGVDNVAEGGFSVNVEGKSIVAGEDALISVYSADGVRVASACGRILDLSTLNGTFVVTAERNGEIRIIKVVL